MSAHLTKKEGPKRYTVEQYRAMMQKSDIPDDARIELERKRLAELAQAKANLSSGPPGEREYSKWASLAGFNVEGDFFDAMAGYNTPSFDFPYLQQRQGLPSSKHKRPSSPEKRQPSERLPLPPETPPAPLDSDRVSRNILTAVVGSALIWTMSSLMDKKAEKPKEPEKPDKPVQVEKEPDKPTLECSICMERPKNCALNCGHLICMKCASNEGNKNCPFCRKPITTRLEIYL